jgi:alginate O-acetyltransferase complex protein AlgI
MVFSSPVFLFLFLPVVLAVYFLLPHRLRNLLLLTASLFFYAWGEKEFIAVLLTSIILNYSLGLWLGRLDGPRARTLVVCLAVALNLALLAAFKYAAFLADNLNLLLTHTGHAPVTLPPLHLPLGISFFTFHALSYVLDVYRREVPPLRRPIDFALYISFFPQSIAGPIIRYSDVAGQLARRAITLDGFASGTACFIIGLAKKMVLANALAGPADAIFNLPDDALTPGLTWLGALCYTLQIYFDFSGYSDMAIGLARLFGFDFRANFNYPYIAQSVTDFWRRWHISLSTWYRDYLYIPLGGNRQGKVRTYFNLLTVFFLCGLWHGASWTFVFWGFFHGAFLVVERVGLGRLLDRLWLPLRHGYALLVVVVGWVFFRAATFTQAVHFLGAMAGQSGTAVEFSPAVYLDNAVLLALLAGPICAGPLLPLAESLRRRALAACQHSPRLSDALEATLAFGSVAVLAGLLLTSAMLLAAGTYNPFIYFRF